ncbi:MAG TPA: glycosyltransferase family 9 protein [Candidatus Udaeobacter sp.]|nr:glycosyltransferase family 9 protein [Candidatus Udaeobacter sp.]
MDRILVIRSGAIGDFILTLPALKALRDAYPDAHIEILGYKHIAALAENRLYAQAVRSIEYGPLSSFFAKNSKLPAELADYFATFDLIVSYLYDPDRIFENNLRRCGVENLLCGPAKIVEKSGHAARQLAQPIEQLGITVADLNERIFPSTDDRRFAQEFLQRSSQAVVAIHPGSGSKDKNWPLENWIELFASKGGLSKEEGPGRMGKHTFVLVSGEADKAQSAQLEHLLKDRDVRFAKNLPLPHLAALLEDTVFVGHDSGISHLAAAAGANCILLFGPTDPDIWAPRNKNVQVLRAKSGNVSDLKIESVGAAVAAALSQPVNKNALRSL